MKKIALILLPFLMAACTAKKGVAAFTEGKHKVENPCPEGGECKFEILKDKSLVIKTDGTGKLYYTLEDTPGRITARYTYTKNSSGYHDDGYSEEVIFETDNGLSNLHQGNAKEAKMLFGVRCFCRGKAGFYKVEEGLLDYEDNKLIIKIQDDIVDGQKINYALVSFK